MSSEATRLRIVSLNAWKNDGDFPARVALIAEGLARLNPDVVCLQECFATEDGEVDVAHDLAAALGLVLYGSTLALALWRGAWARPR